MKNDPQNTKALKHKPFAGFLPEDMALWLSENRTDRDLALAMGEVHNHAGLLQLAWEKEGTPELKCACVPWQELEQQLYQEVFSRMGDAAAYPTDPHAKTPFQKIKPFMEANGFDSGSRWWSKVELDDEEYFEKYREPFVPGYHGCGTTWVVCADRKDPNTGDPEYRWEEGFSLWPTPVNCHLAPFLTEYFDPKFQWEGHRYVLRGLDAPDPYGWNLYSVDSMQKILVDIQKLLQLLRTNPEDPRLEPVMDRWPVYGRRRGQILTEEEAKQYQRRGLPVAIDFYERFCEAMEDMLRAGKGDAVLFMGP